MIFHSLKVRNFKIIEDLELEFPSEGKIGIFGVNEAGKSSLFESIEVALFGIRGQGTKKEDVVTWGKKSSRIYLEFSSGETRYRITREIGANAGHKAELHQSYGNDWKPLSASVNEIQNIIEEVTGLDRDSYSKLIYIGQKDLDALKDLSKGPREKMMNKVMGMDIFDDADKKIKADKDELVHELEKKLADFEGLERDKEAYYKAENEFNEKKKESQDLKLESEKLEKIKKEKERLLNSYDWLKTKITELDIKTKEFEHAEESKTKSEEVKTLIGKKLIVIEDLRNNEKNLTERIGKLDELTKKYKWIEEKNHIEELLKKVEDSIKQLETARNNKKTKEENLKEKQEEYKRKGDAIQNTEREYSQLIKLREEIVKVEDQKKDKQERLINLSNQLALIKSREPIKSKKHIPILPATGVIFGILCILGGIILINSPIGVITLAIGIILILICSFVIIAALTKNEVKEEEISMESLTRDIDTTKSELKTLEQESSKHLNSLGYNSDKDVELRIKKIVANIKDEFSVETYEELKASMKPDLKLIESLNDELADPDDEVNEKLEQNYSEKKRYKKELEKLNESKSLLGIESLVYSKQDYSDCKRSYETLKEQLQNVRIDLNASQELVKSKQDEQKSYEKSIKKYPQIKEECLKIQAEITEKEKNDLNGLKYSKASHEVTKEECTKAINELQEININLAAAKALIASSEKQMKSLKPSVEKYPITEKEITALRGGIKIKEAVKEELKETSKEIRSKIIPYAACKIDQVLPQITEGRYERLEITEDLQFKVYSIDAGEAKPRDVFSGGTQDQFLLALRLAFTESVLDSRIQADKYALLMDECTASSDEIRKQGIFEALTAMKETFSQIFIIAHEDISNQVDYSLFLERGDNGRTKIRLKSW